MANFHNDCDGTAYRMGADGVRVELEGEGFPTYDESSPEYEQLAQSWDNWSDLILDAAQEYDLPPEWILAIISAETGAWSHNPSTQATIGSPAGAQGLMQLMPQYFGGDLHDPRHNVDLGSRFLSELAARHAGDLPKMSANYNAGSVRCAPGRNEWNWVIDHNYTRKVVTFANTAAELDLAGGHASEGPGIMLALGALAVGLVVATLRK